MKKVDRLLSAIKERESENPPYGFMPIVSDKYLMEMCEETPEVLDHLSYLPQGSTDCAKIVRFYGRRIVAEDSIDDFFIENWELT